MPNQRERASRRQLVGWRVPSRYAAWLVLLLAVVALAVYWRASYSTRTMQAARNQLQVGAISEARQSLMRAAENAPDDGTIDMMLAFCFRQSGQFDRWQEALNAAREKGVSRASLQRETQLFRIQSGYLYEGVESQFAEFAGESITTYDVPVAFVAGCLKNDQRALAEQLLDAWNVDSPDDAHVSYMMGKYWETYGDSKQARLHFEAAISLEPRHELAHIALAEMYQQGNQLDQAFRQYAALGSVSHGGDAAALGAARILRKMGRQHEAQAILEPLAETSDSSADVAVELGRIAMDQDNLPSAERWFERANVQQSNDRSVLMSVLYLLGLLGKSTEAERLVARIAAIDRGEARSFGLRVKLMIDPGDAAAAAEQLQSLDVEMTPLETGPTELGAEVERLSPGRRLFAIHCGACHGSEGDGSGLASRHLFPRPRDLRQEASRLVSTRNGVPTLDDTMNVLRRGIPGTSMPAFDELDDDQLRLLAEEVRWLRRAGLRERFVAMLEFEGEEIDEREVGDFVDRMTAPGELIVVPPLGPAETSSLARGKALYRSLGCVSCHGEDGAGAVEQIWHDERGFPVRPRDLARESLKGGQDPASIYLRIAAGMPGTPHPASPGLTKQQLIDVVQFCRSLGREPKHVFTDYQRATLATIRDYLASLESEASR